jgi:hypothetical protein
MKGQGFRNFRRQGGWLQWVGVALSAIGLISDFMGSKKAEKSAERQAEEEAKAEKTVTAERLRQLGVEERTLFGETLAGYAGGGVLSTTPGLTGTRPISGSPSLVLAEQAKEFKFERKITTEVGATKVQQALAGGKSVADAYRYSGYANVAKGLGDVFGQLYQIYKK